jgi:signal transduction histidine kinase
VNPDLRESETRPGFPDPSFQHGRDERWRAISDLSRAIAGHQSVEALFSELRGRLHDVLDFTYLSVVLHDSSTGLMRVWQIEGAPMTSVARLDGIPIQESPSGRVWQTQMPLAIADTTTEATYNGVAQALNRVGVRSFLSLPMTSALRRLGAFNIGNPRPNAYEGIDLELPLLVASHIAVAVDNALRAQEAAELHVSLRDRNAELQREQQRLEEIVSTVPGIVWEARRSHSGQRWVVSFASDALDAILGPDGRRAIPSAARLLSCLTRPSRRDALRYLQSVAAGEGAEPPVVEYESSGRRGWIELRAAALSDGHADGMEIRGVAMEVTARVEAERERLRQNELLVAERVRERSRIAAEIHDTLLQSVVGTSLRLQAIATRMTEGARARDELADTLQELDDAIVSGRRAIQGLRAPVRELGVAVEQAARRLQGTSSVHFRLEMRGAPTALPDTVAETVERVAIEALTNAYRHAQCQHINTSIEYTETSVCVTVTDDGIGILPRAEWTNEDAHFGLSVMRERLEAIGGVLHIESTPSIGTTVAATIPLRQQPPVPPSR